MSRPVAVITGGLRRLGGAIAARLAQDGFDLALHGHTPGEPEGELAGVIAATGVRAEMFVADLADAAGIDGLIPAVAEVFGRSPACLVNSASRFEEDRWADVTLDSLTGHFLVNAAAPARLAQALAAGLGPDERAVVVNILDQRIVSPPDDQAGYTASKLALAGITRALARALAPRVRVCGVAPGLTLPTADFGAEQLARLAKAMPLERLPAPGEVADAVAFLARAASTTGQVIFVDGGASLTSYDRDFVALDRD